jgi:hypothetical protein
MSRWQIVGMVGLVLYSYGAARVYRTWRNRSRVNVIIWWVALGLIGGLCVGLLFVK